MKIRFQADNDVALALVNGVLRRNAAIDFQTAQAAQLDGLPDPEVLTLAAREGRMLVSRDRRSMPGHFTAFLSNNSSPGVLLIKRKASLGQLIEELVTIWLPLKPKNGLTPSNTFRFNAPDNSPTIPLPPVRP
jgi:hypothetical protein